MTPNFSREVLLYLTVILVLFACGNPVEEKPKNEEISLIENISWLAGAWQDTTNKSQWEIWSVNGNELKGNGLFIKENDTSTFEELAVIEYNNQLAYVANVKENGGPVYFLSTELKANSVVFENQMHDFPKVISYRLFKKETTIGKGDILKTDVMGDDRILSFTLVRR